MFVRNLLKKFDIFVNWCWSISWVLYYLGPALKIIYYSFKYVLMSLWYALNLFICIVYTVANINIFVNAKNDSSLILMNYFDSEFPRLNQRRPRPLTLLSYTSTGTLPLLSKGPILLYRDGIYWQGLAT